MRTLAALLLLSVTLAPPFGEAEARAVEVGADGMVVEVTVEVDAAALVVLVRGASRFEEIPPVAMADLGDGRWGGILELPVVEDLQVGFELIRPDGGSAIVSPTHSLTELGVDPAVFAAVTDAPTTTTSGDDADGSSDAEAAADTEGDSAPSTLPIWLGVIAGALALLLVLVWWWGDRSAGEPEGDVTEPGDGSES